MLMQRSFNILWLKVKNCFQYVHILNILECMNEMSELTRFVVYVTAAELEGIKAKAEGKRLTVSNYARGRMGLKPITRGAPEGNQNALGHVKKKKVKTESDG